MHNNSRFTGNCPSPFFHTATANAAVLVTCTNQAARKGKEKTDVQGTAWLSRLQGSPQRRKPWFPTATKALDGY